MNKHLSLTHTRQQDGSYVVQITHQTYRNAEFNFGTCSFKASNGVRLESSWCPEYFPPIHPKSPILVFVRGEDTSQDAFPIYIPNRVFLDKLLLAVQEYNRYVQTHFNDIHKTT